MKTGTVAGAVIASMMMCAQADAAQYAFTMTGKISYIAHTKYTNSGSQPLDIQTALKLSDDVSLFAVFDPADYPLFNSADTDPTFGYYFGGVREVTLKLGGYTYTSKPGQESFGSITVTDDRSLENVSPRYDGWSFINLLNVTGQDMPVDLGPGQTVVSFNFSGFDFSGVARNSDSVFDVPDLSRYSSQSGSVGFYNTNLSRFSTYLLDDLRTSISPVPGPATWALLLTGFVMTGYGLRRQKVAFRSV